MNERLLTASDVAELLGLSSGTVLDRFERGDLPGFKLGRSRASPVRFRESEIEAWLESCRAGKETPSRGAVSDPTTTSRKPTIFRAVSDPKFHHEEDEDAS